MSAKEFIHLHLHSDYSLLDGAIQHDALAEHAANLKFPAIAVTDHGNMFGAMSFYNATKKRGVRPIVGMEAYVARGSRHDRGNTENEGEKGTNHLILLAKNEKGYENLVYLSSMGYTEGYYYKPRVDKQLLAERSEGLVALSACMSGVPSSLILRDRFDRALCEVGEYNEIFGKGNYFLELQCHEGIEETQAKVNGGLTEIARKLDIPLVVTNDAHFLTREDFRAHQALLCLQTGRTINQASMHYSPDHYVKSAEQMWRLFENQNAEALRNTVRIAEMCQFEFPKAKMHLPVYPVPEGYTLSGYFEKVAQDGLEERFTLLRELAAQGALRYPLEKYTERLDWEISIIKKMGYEGYFLIVWDFIRYARDNGVSVGPGRGSAAGSLVAYAMKITDVDPMHFDLLFERFLNPERVSMPDIDVDFCVRGRGRVIEHVSELYGRENVSQIATFGTMASRAVIKDVGRVLDMPYAEVEKIAKLIPPPQRGRNVAIAEALKIVPELKSAYQESPKVKEMIDLALRLEGCARHSSIHAAGVVIAPQPVHELVPVFKTKAKDKERGGEIEVLATQYNMNDLEKAGMLKMDFLGLTTLTIIEDCLDNIARETGERPDLSRISYDDPAALKLFGDGETEAIFQFEGDGIKEITRRLKPDGLGDIVALNALYRPGPLDSGMVDDYIERRHGRKRIAYDFKDLKDVLESTYGVPVFQEQIMAIFQRLAGYSLGEADLVRRAMGKKKREELDAHKAKFFERAEARGHERGKLEKLWQQLEGFADYAFNKSHSVCYGVLAYQTAYLKARFPAHFWAAVLTSELNNTDKVARYIERARVQGIEVLPPDVNVSLHGFTSRGNQIRFGLMAIKGIGESAVDAIVAARNQDGAFTSIYNLVERVDSRALNRRVMESLVKSGGMDALPGTRAQKFAAIEGAMEYGARRQRDLSSGQVSLFGAVEDANSGAEEPLPSAPDWTEKETLAGEKATVGFYVTGHPLAGFRETLNAVASVSYDRLRTCEPNSQIKMGGVIVGYTVKNTKKGDRFAVFMLEDEHGSIEVIAWPETFKRLSDKISEDMPALITGKLEFNEDGPAKIIAENAEPLVGLKERRAQMVRLYFPTGSLNEAKIERLSSLLARNHGECPVMFEVQLPTGAVATVRPTNLLRVKARPELAQEICGVCPGCDVRFS